MPPLRVAVIGAGAFGRNHLRVYRELEAAHPDTVQLSALVEPDAKRRAHAAALYSIPAFAAVDDLLAANLALHAASVCVPTLHHAAVAEQLLRAGLDVLIEKPFASTLAEADRILLLARERARVVAVGHLERFNPAVTAAAQRITHPMFFEAHRLSVFTPRSLDVDVVLDLMIHDLDIVLALTPSAAKEVRAVGLPVLSPRVDIANVRIEFDSGCIANFTASRVSTEQVRKLRLFQPHEYLSLDFARQELLAIKVDPAAMRQHLVSPASLNLSSRPESSRSEDAAERPLYSVPPPTNALSSRPESPRSGDAVERPAALQPQPAGSHPSAGLSLDKLNLPHAEPLRLELEDFLAAVRNRTPPRVTAEAGRAALSLALEVNHQIAEHAHRAGLK